jgi:hypothetical protein
MKAISLWEPWASAMAVGLKANETRNLPTHYRGQLAICSAKKLPSAVHVHEAVVCLLWNNRQRFPGYHGNMMDLLLSLPFGKVVCVVDVFDCRPTELETGWITFEEYLLGNYAPGRWVWKTRNYKKLEHPVPVMGRQGFFNLPPDVEEKVKNQL